MPINLLKHILDNQSSIESTCQVIRYASKQNSRAIEGYYLYTQGDLVEQEWMFNDGIPSIILFAKRQDSVKINTELKEMIFESGWVDKGLQKKVFISYPRDFEYLLVIRFKPQVFTQITSAELNNAISQGLLPIEDFLSNKIIDHFFSIESIEERIKYLDSYLNSCIVCDTNLDSLDQAIQIIEDSQGLITVGELTKILGVNYKWLERNFSKHLHFTPKEYISMHRFMRAYLNMQKDSSDLLALAITHGFYDYNHFLKEFKSYTGQTPLAYLAR
ncbi:MAG: helix-turn-helix domain-containing protein [Flavobacteriaceae bacterium]|jgi:AraC-like DNA-binding protein|nr:helix-turn-helix domain-containing protein [Flavobacteriaceae bacterium]